MVDIHIALFSIHAFVQNGLPVSVYTTAGVANLTTRISPCEKHGAREYRINYYKEVLSTKPPLADLYLLTSICRLPHEWDVDVFALQGETRLEQHSQLHRHGVPLVSSNFLMESSAI